jgi:hypothetical protein
LSIVTQVEASTGTPFGEINVQLAYLCIQVGLNVVYTILVSFRLFAMRNQLKQVTGQYDSTTYSTIVLMVVESAMPYSIFAIFFIVTFALPNEGLITISFLTIGKVQVSRKVETTCISDAIVFCC